jgi:hypothetical protein
VKFGFIAKHRGIWPADWLCEALGVSRGGFYAWLTRPRSRGGPNFSRHPPPQNSRREPLSRISGAALILASSANDGPGKILRGSPAFASRPAVALDVNSRRDSPAGDRTLPEPLTVGTAIKETVAAIGSMWRHGALLL